MPSGPSVKHHCTENVGLTCSVLILDQVLHADDIFNILWTLSGQLLAHRLSHTLGLLGCTASTTLTVACPTGESPSILQQVTLFVLLPLRL